VRPGVNIIQKETRPPLALPTESSVFMIGVTEKGPLAPVVSLTPTQWTNNHGARTTTTSTMADAAEFLFKEGAKRIITSRVVGPGAVTASVSVLDGSSATVFTAKAKGPGAYGNDLNVVVRTSVQDSNIPAGSFVLRIQRDDGVTIVEESPVLLDKAAALYWMDGTSQYIAYTDGASTNDPAAATYALAGGSDDVAGITDTQWQAALDRIPADYGTGIVMAPGRTTSAGHTQLKNHADLYRRVAYLDAPDTPTVATVAATAAANRGRLTGLFWPWVRVAGLTPGTYRVVPPSVIVGGISSFNDAQGMSPNAPAAGVNGVSRTALGLTQTVIDSDHQLLNDSGVNVIKSRYGEIRVMGWRTTSLEASDPRWINLGNSRLYCYISNAALLIGERFLFREIDGQGRTVAEWGSALVGEVMMPLFLAGSLYGTTPAEAFRVDLAENTGATAQARQLLATIVYVDSQFGEEVDVSIAKQLISEGVS
jgi:phage tail sheath protein FI